jgi:hypothetical protein
MLDPIQESLEQIHAIQAVNFICLYGYSWLINTNMPSNYNIDSMITLAKSIADQRGLKLIMKVTPVPGYIDLIAEEGWVGETARTEGACQADRDITEHRTRKIADAAS